MTALRRQTHRVVGALLGILGYLLYLILSLPFGIGYILVFIVVVAAYSMLVQVVAGALGIDQDLAWWTITAGIVGFAFGFGYRPSIDKYRENRRHRREDAPGPEAPADLSEEQPIQETEMAEVQKRIDKPHIVDLGGAASVDTEDINLSTSAETPYWHSWPFPGPDGSFEFVSPTPSEISKALRLEFTTALPADLTPEEMHERWHAHLEDHPQIWRSCHGGLKDRMEEISFFRDFQAESIGGEPDR